MPFLRADGNAGAWDTGRRIAPRGGPTKDDLVSALHSREQLRALLHTFYRRERWPSLTAAGKKKRHEAKEHGAIENGNHRKLTID